MNLQIYVIFFEQIFLILSENLSYDLSKYILLFDQIYLILFANLSYFFWAILSYSRMVMLQNSAINSWKADCFSFTLSSSVVDVTIDFASVKP